MLAIGIEFLMGRSVAARWENRDKPEWPPHPDRVFMALVAAWGETGERPEIYRVLKWLESLDHPQIAASGIVSERSEFTSYVPANDTQVPKTSAKGEVTAELVAKGLRLLPDRRNRNARTFPAVVPEDSLVYLVWPDATPSEEQQAALVQVCRCVTYLGHSSTPVRMWASPHPGKVTLWPTTGRASVRLRSFGPGRLDDLQAWYRADLRPQATLWVGYSDTSPTALPAVEADHPYEAAIFVMRQAGGRPFVLESTGLVIDAVRKVLLARHGAEPPEWLSGHGDGSEPSKVHRPAYLPLAHVGYEYADGHLMGIGIAIPTGFPHTEELFSLLSKRDERTPDDIDPGVPFLSTEVFNPHLKDGKVGALVLELDEQGERTPRRALRPSTWVAPSDCWTTVTPVMLPQFPRRGLTPEDVIADACEQSGYPRPAAVRVQHAPLLAGVPHARSFHVKPRQGRPPRPLIHARLLFDQAVRGPVVIGAGRYAGYGLCRPTPGETT